MSMQKPFWQYFWIANFCFRAMGILPTSESSYFLTSATSAFLAILPFVYGAFLISKPINDILYQSHTTDDLLEAVIVAISVSGGLFRAFFVMMNRHKIVRLFRLCIKLWDQATPEDYKVISNWARKAKLFTTTYFCVAQFATILFILAAIIRQISTPANSTIRYYPFGFEEGSTPSRYYEVKFALQVISGQLGMMYVAGTDMAGTLIVFTMCGQLVLIRSWLEEIFKQKLNTERHQISKRLDTLWRKCIKRHQVVLQMCAELEDAIRLINLIQILAGTYMLAISEARLLRTLKSYRYVGTLLLAMSGLFCSCWPADNLSSANDELRQAFYGVPWYDCLPQQRISVVLMLMRSQRPVKITAGKFVTLSLATFSTIISNSVSFCMVLNSF